MRAGKLRHRALIQSPSKVNVAGWPVKMSDSHVPVKSSPLLGADNETIYGDWLGYSADDVKDMRERRVI